MKNDYKKIQEKIKKSVVKHLNDKVSSPTERTSILYSDYNEYVLMTAFNHQEYFIPKEDIKEDFKHLRAIKHIKIKL